MLKSARPSVLQHTRQLRERDYHSAVHRLLDGAFVVADSLAHELDRGQALPGPDDLTGPINER